MARSPPSFCNRESVPMLVVNRRASHPRSRPRLRDQPHSQSTGPNTYRHPHTHPHISVHPHIHHVSTPAAILQLSGNGKLFSKHGLPPSLVFCLPTPLPCRG
ncbi:hypothetical protein CDEST_05158 [Colletotrichum destructivum]|uniref:Uncharacterized protein n=1 Tax=Colletotrichum destructivum TaxID=34406 RepID=A0AAX4IA32_9PEZI|nr:hypothetical protein CDEST_05158 [Colletotrichum destructivum]